MQFLFEQTLLCTWHYIRIHVVFSVPQPWSGVFNAVSLDLLIAGELLVIMCDLEDHTRPGENADIAQQQSGIYTLRKSNLVQNSFVHGHFVSMKGNEDGSFIAALDDEGDVTIFTIDNGRVFPVRSFPTGQFADGFSSPSILMVSDTKVAISGTARE